MGYLPASEDAGDISSLRVLADKLLLQVGWHLHQCRSAQHRTLWSTVAPHTQLQLCKHICLCFRKACLFISCTWQYANSLNQPKSSLAEMPLSISMQSCCCLKTDLTVEGNPGTTFDMAALPAPTSISFRLSLADALHPRNKVCASYCAVRHAGPRASSAPTLHTKAHRRLSVELMTGKRERERSSIET